MLELTLVAPTAHLLQDIAKWKNLRVRRCWNADYYEMIVFDEQSPHTLTMLQRYITHNITQLPPTTNCGITNEHDNLKYPPM